MHGKLIETETTPSWIRIGGIETESKLDMRRTNSNSVWIADSCIACGSHSLMVNPAILMPFIAHRALNWGPVQIDKSWNLNDIETGTAYTRVNTLACDECGTIFVDLRLGDTQMNRLYDHYRGKDYVRTRARFEPHYKQRNKLFDKPYKHIPKVEAKIKKWIGVPGSILDWGGGSGLNTPFRQTVKQIYCSDISGEDLQPGVRIFSRETSPDVFGLVVCCQVLEHVSSPLDILTELKTYMDKSSFLYLDFPFEKLMQSDEGSREKIKQKRHWHEHINFFSEAGIKKLIKYAGLDLVQFEVLEIDIEDTAAKIFQVLCKLA